MFIEMKTFKISSMTRNPAIKVGAWTWLPFFEAVRRPQIKKTFFAFKKKGIKNIVLWLDAYVTSDPQTDVHI